LWPAEFNLTKTAGLVQELLRHCEFVIVDAPPLLVVTDTYQFVGATDCILAVVRNNKTSASAVREMAKILQRLAAKHVQLTVTEAESRFESGYYYRESAEAGEERKQQQRAGS
jgi:Mrp family chromosome partitioning ATPase